MQVTPAPLIEEALLQIFESDSSIGSGCFGSCTEMVYKDTFLVCVKKFTNEVTSYKQEAAIFCAFNDGPYTPHCFGFCQANRSIVMMYIHVADKPVSLHVLLCDKHLIGVSVSKDLGYDILVDIYRGLMYIHKKGFLHNDLKLDNVVIGTAISRKFRAFIIDFGKSCHFDCGRQYKLTEEQKVAYKKEHAQVAPDLRDGFVPQSFLSDVYSFG